MSQTRTPKRLGRPPGKPSKARKHALLVKVTEGEKMIIKERAGDTPVATYLRLRGTGQA